MNSERLYSAKPWDVIQGSADPAVTSYKRNLDRCLSGMPEDSHKVDVKARLRGQTESGHYSARLELFLHDLLTNVSGQHPRIHPDLSDVSTHPDFLVQHQLGDLIVEAVVALDSEGRRDQEARLRQAVDAVGSIRGTVDLYFQLVSDLPRNYPVRRIQAFLRREVPKIRPQSPDQPGTLSFRDEFEENNTEKVSVEIDFTVLGHHPEYHSAVQVFGHADAEVVAVYQRIKLAISSKATKYGNLDMPYLVVVWPKTNFPALDSQIERALYGGL